MNYCGKSGCLGHLDASGRCSSSSYSYDLPKFDIPKLDLPIIPEPKIDLLPKIDPPKLYVEPKPKPLTFIEGDYHLDRTGWLLRNRPPGF